MAFGPLFSLPQQIIFSWVGIDLYRKQATRNSTQPSSLQTGYCYECCSTSAVANNATERASCVRALWRKRAIGVRMRCSHFLLGSWEISYRHRPYSINPLTLKPSTATAYPVHDTTIFLTCLKLQLVLSLRNECNLNSKQLQEWPNSEFK